MATPNIVNPDKPWESFQVDEEMGWGETLLSGVEAMPRSTVGVVSDVYEAATSPVETGKSIIKLMSGGLQNMLGDNISNFVNEQGQLIGLGDDSADKELASAFGKFYTDKYGSEESIKNAIATDPASVLGDAATLIMGGGGAISKLGKISKAPKITQTGAALSKTASYVDPLSLTAKSIGGAGYLGSQVAKHTAGVASGVGNVPLEQAYRAGLKGGDIQEMFLANLKGDVPMDHALQIAKDNLDKMKIQKQDQYKQNQKEWKGDEHQLSFDDIDASLAKADNIVGFKGQMVDPVATKALDEIRKVINQWKQLEPSEFHTPEGIDALKQAVWAKVEGIPFENRKASAVGKNVYHSIKNTIAKQSPSYAKAMKEYTESSEMINEIQRALSLGDKASIDTSLRKLQSLMRDNTSTNYGNRQKLADKLEQAGKQEFMPALAGQTLKQVEPRGIARATTLPTAGGAALYDPIAGVTALGMSSPRLTGTMSNIAGNVMGRAKEARGKVPVSDEGIQGLLNFLYQTQQFQEDK